MLLELLYDPEFDSCAALRSAKMARCEVEYGSIIGDSVDCIPSLRLLKRYRVDLGRNRNTRPGVAALGKEASLLGRNLKSSRFRARKVSAFGLINSIYCGVNVGLSLAGVQVSKSIGNAPSESARGEPLASIPSHVQQSQAHSFSVSSIHAHERRCAVNGMHQQAG